MMALSADDVADLRRWLISGAVVVLAYGAIAATVVNWRDEIEAAEPAAAIVIEFAPVPVAPPTPQADIAPGPEQVMSEASPERPVEQVEEKQKIEEKIASRPVEEPPPEIKPAPNPDVALEPPHQEVTRAQPQNTQGQITPNTSSALPTWKSQMLALLERNKRYPESAQSRHQQGTAQVFFSLDRQGRVVASRIVRSSGTDVLDDEALALLHRAQPFPPPPPELPGPRIDLTVPIRFNLK
jgi:periplasmic protein TonB